MRVPPISTHSRRILAIALPGHDRHHLSEAPAGQTPARPGTDEKHATSPTTRNFTTEITESTENDKMRRERQLMGFANPRSWKWSSPWAP